MSAVSTPSSMVRSQALWTRVAACVRPRCTSIITADSSRPDGLARSRPAMSGAEPCTASNMAQSRPMLDEGAMPIEPATSAATSDRMSPYRLGATTTSKRSGSTAILAVPMSMIMCSAASSGYSAAISSKTRWNRPSVSFMMLSLVMQVSLRRPWLRAYSKA